MTITQNSEPQIRIEKLKALNVFTIFHQQSWLCIIVEVVWVAETKRKHWKAIFGRLDIGLLNICGRQMA